MASAAKNTDNSAQNSISKTTEMEMEICLHIVLLKICFCDNQKSRSKHEEMWKLSQRDANVQYSIRDVSFFVEFKDFY